MIGKLGKSEYGDMRNDQLVEALKNLTQGQNIGSLPEEVAEKIDEINRILDLRDQKSENEKPR